MVSEDAKHRLHFFNGLQNSGPFSDTGNFAGINAEGFTVEQEAKVFYVCLFKGAFLGFEEEGFSLEKVKDVMYNLVMEGRIIRSGD